jgi:hypothetical protein
MPLDSSAASHEQPESVERLQRLWEQGARVDLEEFLQAVGPLEAEDLAAVLHVDQHQRWQMGERAIAESYLLRFPDVCQDAEAVVDLIFHEYLLRERLGELPGPKEFAERFPAYAEALKNQIAFHRLLAEGETPLAEPMFAAATVTNPVHRASQAGLPEQAQIDLVARGRFSSTREVQTLLRQRLRLFSLLTFGMFLLLTPVVWAVLAGHWGVALYAAVIAETGLFAALLSSRRPFSMGAMRWIEASLMMSLLLYFAWDQVQLFQAGDLLAHAGHGWFGPLVAARSLNWPWAVAILIYGIWIPNTFRRSVIAVAAMSVSSLAITLGLALTAESASKSAIAGFVLYATTHTVGAAVIAVSCAYRIQTLQRAVSEARKLGPYRLIRRLGAGGMGEVYLAEHALLQRPCALKLIRPEQSGDAHFLSRFEREVQSMAALTHPNTVRIFDYGLTADGTFYYAMEYLPGLSLQELVAQYGPLPPGRAVYLLRQVCEALREAHSVGLVHRDIKPANILASQMGGMYDVAKLLDFGLVRVHGLSSSGISLTGVGTIAGTPAFMSPEQAAGATDVDPRSDIYSLGAVAYFLLTGRPPFVEPTSVQTMAAHLSEAVAPLSVFGHEIPTDLEKVVLRCLEKERGRRFPDVVGLEEALAGCASCDAWSSERAADWWQNKHVAPSERDLEPDA